MAVTWNRWLGGCDLSTEGSVVRRSGCWLHAAARRRSAQCTSACHPHQQQHPGQGAHLGGGQEAGGGVDGALGVVELEVGRLQREERTVGGALMG